MIGDAQGGPFDTPAAYGTASAVKSTFTSGPLVEAACYEIEHYGKPVVLTRSKRTTAGSTTNLVITGVLGTCTPAVDGSVAPTDDGEIVVKIPAGGGGTVGTGPISYQWSRDGGRTFSVATALGTAAFFTVPGSGVKFLLDAASTLLAGDTWSVVAHAPRGATADWADAIDVLGASKLNWEYCTVLGDALGADLDMVETKRTGLAAKGKHRWFQLHFRMPTVGETDGAYQTAFSAAFTSHRSVGIEVFSGAAKIQSSVSFFQYRRSPAYAVAPVYASVSHEIDIAKILLGPLPGVQIRDANGNLDEHDELEQPGLDDMMSTVLRTWDGRDGVYVNNPRIHSAVGSDFVYVQYRRVMNLARTALRSYLETRLSSEVVVDAKTGFLVKSEADDIDSGANAALSAVLDGAPKASPSLPSKPRFTVHRNDNVLATSLIRYDMRIIPLGYIKFLDGESGFNNPASRVVTG